MKKLQLTLTIVLTLAIARPVYAQDRVAEALETTPAPEKAAPVQPGCAANDRTCIIEMLSNAAGRIERADWRDQTYRELAKTLAFDGDVDGAIAVIDKISSNDTKAMTIRGIGMAVADRKQPKAENDIVFAKLKEAAAKIADGPSNAIAMTYVAMSQAFAGDNEGAWQTASEMKNEALRHKAYGETAEIQAENGDFYAAMTSIDYITSPSFKNKAYNTVSKILADGQLISEATQAALAISDPYMQAEALQYALDTQKPRDIPHQ